MLLLLLSLFSYYELLNCDTVKFNESLLVGQHRQNLLQISAFLKDVHHKINDEGSMLTVDGYAHETRDKIDHINQNFPQTSFLPIPIDYKFPDKAYTTRRFSPVFYPPTLGPESGLHRSVPQGYPPLPANIPKPPLRPDSYPSPLYYDPNVSPVVITRGSFPFPMSPYTTEVDVRHKWDESFTDQHPLDHPLHAPMTFNPQTPWTSKQPSGKEYTYQRYYDKSFESRPNTRSLRDQKLKRPAFPSPKIRSSPVLKSTDSGEDSISSGQTATFKTKYRETMKIWLGKVTKYTPVEIWVKTLAMQTRVTSSYHYTSLPKSSKPTAHNIPPSAKRDPKIIHTLSNPQKWVRNRQSEDGSKNPTQSVYRHGISRPDRPTKVEKHGISRTTDKQEHIYLEDKRGFLHDGTTPGTVKKTRTTMVDGRSTYNPNHAEMNWAKPTTSRIKLVRANKNSKPPEKSVNKFYHAMMHQFKEGYMMVFLLELSRLISTKNKKDVHDVITHTEMIINNLFHTSQLSWFGQPLLDSTLKLGILLSEAETDVVQGYASMLYHMLRDRKTTMAVDVNAILNYANKLHENAEGELLFDTIREFQKYPNITKTGRQLCDSLIKNFLNPFRRLHQSEKLQALLDSINHALKNRFSRARFKEETVPPSSEEQESSDTQEESSSGALRSYSSESNSRQKHQSLRQNSTRQRYQNHRYRHTEDSNKNIQLKPNSQYEKFPKLRKMIRIINPAKTASADSLKYETNEIKTRTTVYTFLNRMTRPTREHVFTEKEKEGSYQKSKSQHDITDRHYQHNLNEETEEESRIKHIDDKQSEPELEHVFTEKEKEDSYQKSKSQHDTTDRHFQNNSNEGTEDESRIKHIDDKQSEPELNSTEKAVLRERQELYQQVKKRLESESFKTAQRKKFKAELLRKIVEGSSYSDEEASLKMNLIEALHHDNRSFIDAAVITNDPQTSVTPAEELKYTAGLRSSDEHR